MNVRNSTLLLVLNTITMIGVFGTVGWQPQDPSRKADQVQRFGMVIGIKAEKVDYYTELHANTWSSVLHQISKSNIRNYSIFLKQVGEDNWYLFSYFEYVGDDFAADMKRIGDDPETKRWWTETDPCQIPVPNRQEGEWWSKMERVFYHP